MQKSAIASGSKGVGATCFLYRYKHEKFSRQKHLLGFFRLRQHYWQYEFGPGGRIGRRISLQKSACWLLTSSDSGTATMIGCRESSSLRQRILSNFWSKLNHEVTATTSRGDRCRRLVGLSSVESERTERSDICRRSLRSSSGSWLGLKSSLRAFAGLPNRPCRRLFLSTHDSQGTESSVESIRRSVWWYPPRRTIR